MARDLRDPTMMGEALLTMKRNPKARLSKVASDFFVHNILTNGIPDYVSPESPVEKYGRPQDVPERYATIRIA